MISVATGFFVFLFGIVVGSFMNVCSWRFPRDESVLTPRYSRCPSCRKTIAWHDNIPLVSFLLLGGKCRVCKHPISIRYFAGELICGLLWVWLWKVYGLTPHFFAGTILVSILMAVTFSDFETGLIPDKLSYPGMAAGLVMSAVFPELHGETLWVRGLLASALGLVAGGGLLLAVGWIGNLVFRKESMGGGDVKLLAMMGAFLGVKKVMFVFLFAPFLAVPFALYMKFSRKAETIPYGPFLAVAGVGFYIHGKQLISLILKTYGV